MQTNDILIDAFTRIKDIVHGVVKGLSETELNYRPNKEANSICWLVWHLTRIQDDHMAGMMNKEQVWNKWQSKFNLPLNASDTGWGHSTKLVGLVKASSKNLLGYYDEVHKRTIKYLKTLKESDYTKVVDKRWNPPVTLGVRIVSVISDDMQHAGQAAYVKGLLK